MSSQPPDGIVPISKAGRDERAPSTTLPVLRTLPLPGTSHAPQPGSFNPTLKSTITARGEPRPDFSTLRSYKSDRADEEDERTASEQRQAEYRLQIEKETKIKIGSENLLEALNSKNAKQSRDQRLRVESELQSANQKIAKLKLDLEYEIQRYKDGPLSPASKPAQLFRGVPARSPSYPLSDFEEGSDDETESPTIVLADILQSLESVGMPAEYYVDHCNNLVDLFKRHPSLKYDLVWSIFGLRVQTLLLSDSREVVAAGYRVMRYSITDRKSLTIIRSLHTDYLVVLSLVKESKASVEREQALKFVRAFLDVVGGVREIAKSVVRVIVAIAEHHEDRMRNICILTMAEILVHDPALVVSAAGVGCLLEALTDENYYSSESLTNAFIHLLDFPTLRRPLGQGLGLDAPFAAFTDGAPVQESSLKASAKVIAAFLKTWPGLLTFSRNDFQALRSLVGSLQIPNVRARDVVLEILFDVLRIKQPSWSSSFLAGRRLTTYGRVLNVKTATNEAGTMEDEQPRKELVEHFTAAVLGVLLTCGLASSLLFLLEHEEDASIKRKATLLLVEVLNMAGKVIPHPQSLQLHTLPGLFLAASSLDSTNRTVFSSTVYQIDSISRALFRTNEPFGSRDINNNGQRPNGVLRRQSDLNRDALTPQIEEGYFRNVLVDTQVLNSSSFTKWRWDLIPKIVEGPLLNPKRLEEATKATKFVKRLIGFYRPFKYRFSNIRNTKPNQRYVRIGCMLLRTLLQTTEGTKYLAENKLLRQIAECLAQVDRLSGLTSTSPLFSRQNMSETLTGGYFAMLGVLSGTTQGLAMMERWKMVNMFYHIVELPDRDDLIMSLLGNLNYVLDSQLRVLLSKALTACSRETRLFTTRLLRKYATQRVALPEGGEYDRSYAEWAINLLVTQLYDPDIDVCEAAVKILEEACNETQALEFVVRCRPALDHLGEIGAPLLLRFLSTSIGYHFLNELDYISQEMDDWFLGRNDTYVLLVEASLAKAMTEGRSPLKSTAEEGSEARNHGTAPPHFYRELARTEEGCKLLESKGHFEEFISTIRSHGMEETDHEMVLRVKGCLWAIANIGSMELGAPFLEKTDVVELIIKIAEESQVMSMRGTAYFALGLISRSVYGQDVLASSGWEVAVDEYGESLGICLPSRLDRLLNVGHRLAETLQSANRRADEDMERWLGAQGAGRHGKRRTGRGRDECQDLIPSEGSRQRCADQGESKRTSQVRAAVGRCGGRAG